jgi:hypothetical protein
MIGMTSRNLQGVRNTFYYGLQVVHCVRRSRRYRKSSKTTKYVLKAVVCISTMKIANEQMAIIRAECELEAKKHALSEVQKATGMDVDDANDNEGSNSAPDEHTVCY